MRTFLSRHVAKAAGLIGLAAFAILIFAGPDLDSPAGAAVLVVFRTLGASFHLVANLLAYHLPHLPGWIDAPLVVIVGALPYVLLDACWRTMHVRWRRAVTARPPVPPPNTQQ